MNSPHPQTSRMFEAVLEANLAANSAKCRCRQRRPWAAGVRVDGGGGGQFCERLANI